MLLIMVFNAQNFVIFAPPSSGKTLISLIASTKIVAKGFNIVYVVTQEAKLLGLQVRGITKIIKSIS